MSQDTHPPSPNSPSSEPAAGAPPQGGSAAAAGSSPWQPTRPTPPAGSAADTASAAPATPPAPVPPAGPTAYPPPTYPPPAYAPPGYGPPTYYMPRPAGPLPPRRRRPWWVWLLLLGSAVGLVVILISVVGPMILEGLGLQTSPVVESTYQSGDSRYRIVILPVSGIIDEQQGAFVHDALAELRRNPPVAIVLRVDSPGGGVGASDRIYRELSVYHEQTHVPIVTSMASLAASGGYYVSCASQYIVAERTTITGSIGVIGGGLTFERLLDKVGVTPQIHHSTNAADKDVLNPYRKWEQRDVDLLVNILNDAQTRFEEVVAKGRAEHLTPAQVKACATGAPFTSKQALEKKLVDEIGYFDAAVAKARSLAGVPANARAKITRLGRQPTLLDLMGVRQADPGVRVEALNAEQIRHWMEELSTPKIEYRWTMQ